MKLVLDIFFFFVITFFCYQFAQVIIRIKQGITFPIIEAELNGVRKHPMKPLNPPTFAGQKVGIFIYGSLLVAVIVLYLSGIYNHITVLTFYFMIVLIFTYSNFALNLFAIHKDGIISGVRFVPWKTVRSFHFIPIDQNHRFYGFTTETNNGYELKIKAKISSINCVVTDEKIKRELELLLEEHVKIS